MRSRSFRSFVVLPLVLLTLACRSTTSDVAPSAAHETPASSVEAARAVISQFDDRSVADVLMRWHVANEHLRAGRKDEAGRAAGQPILELVDRIRPLTANELAILGQLAVVAHAAGYERTAARAAARIEHQKRAPGEPYTSLVRLPLAELPTGPVRIPHVEPPPALGTIIERLEELTAEVVAETDEHAAPSVDDATDASAARERDAIEATAPLDARVRAGDSSEATPRDGSSRDSGARKRAPRREAQPDFGSLRALFVEARTAFERGDFAEAAAILEALLAEAERLAPPPDDLICDARLLLAAVEAKLGHLTRMEEALRALVALRTTPGRTVSDSAFARAAARLIALLLARRDFASASQLAGDVRAVVLRDGDAEAERAKADLDGVLDLADRSAPADVPPRPETWAVDPDLEAARRAWIAGHFESAWTSASTALARAEAQETDPRRLRALRLWVARLAIDAGRLERAHELVQRVLNGDGGVAVADGDQRAAALALLERIETLRDVARNCAGAIVAFVADRDEPAPHASLAEDAWIPPSSDALVDALHGANPPPPSPPRTTVFDVRAAESEARRLADACELGRALSLRRDIASHYRARRPHDDGERVEALRELAALYRVTGASGAAREIELALPR